MIYVFHPTPTDRVKIAVLGRTGVCLFAKRLEGAKFRWPKLRTA